MKNVTVNYFYLDVTDLDCWHSVFLSMFSLKEKCVRDDETLVLVTLRENQLPADYSNSTKNIVFAASYFERKVFCFIS